tara:strand:+ start:901 stop:1200 length:300 start_codon:yes stop_codon:yes gene_type:complete
MLDYYGSISMKESEIDSQIISSFSRYCSEKYIQQIISDLRKENILQTEYSLSGWNVFFKKDIYSEITQRIQLYKNKQKLAFIKCTDLSLDICESICNQL